jgi:hypothetical protein
MAEHFGYNQIVEFIKPGEKFKITPDFEAGEIISSESVCKLVLTNQFDIVEDEFDQYDNEPDENEIAFDDLVNEAHTASLPVRTGWYLFHKDGVTIQRISDIFEGDED